MEYKSIGVFSILNESNSIKKEKEFICDILNNLHSIYTFMKSGNFSKMRIRRLINNIENYLEKDDSY